MSDLPEYTTKDVAGHKTRDDLWVAINGKVYDITPYVRDHPGGPDLLIEVAGTDATEAYEDIGHSEDADEILRSYLIGTLKGGLKRTRPEAVRIIQPVKPSPPTPTQTSGSGSLKTAALATVSLSGAAISLYFGPRMFASLPATAPGVAELRSLLKSIKRPSTRFTPGEFYTGFAVATGIFSVLGSVFVSKLTKMIEVKSGFTKYPPYVKRRKVAQHNPHLTKGFLDAKEYRALPLIRKESLSPSVYKFVFQLPTPQDVLGLPIGQHVAVKATIDGTSVSRSYTPTSNNLDKGLLELVIRCYPDGLLTGKYFANLNIGDEVLFRGPKGAMKYSKDLCKKIGMIAGGTGITPMYQLIRAICEDPKDLTEVSLIYANRSETDILMRTELEAFARDYPKNLKIWYMLDQPPKDWAYGSGYVTADVMQARLPAPEPDTKIMLCGPPGMVNASKKALVGMGFKAPGAAAKTSDEIFCF
ncbi:hypothetical protein BJX76DRAFT_364454 [Aspergillus varians]